MHVGAHMNRNFPYWRLVLATVLACTLVVSGYDYNVHMPSNELRPQWSGAKAGVWTLDYDAAAAKAKAEGKIHVMMLTGSWWCPFCQNFENKVALSDAWRNYVKDKGYYLSMLDYPYRFEVDAAQMSKSKYPELGDGWGFQCWLYDDAYLSEHGLSVEDGFRAIRRMYEKQGELALDTAELFTMRDWDGSSEFTYGKVGYPTLIVFLPDGTEAGRFSAASSIYKMEPEEAQRYVMGQIDDIVSTALDAQCGLCSDPDADECGPLGSENLRYRGWLSGSDGSVSGTITVASSKVTTKGIIRVKATVSVAGHAVSLLAETTSGCETLMLTKGDKTAILKLGVSGLSGTYTDGIVSYDVIGARDAFWASKDDVVMKTRAEALSIGTWGLVMRSEPSGNPMASGYGALTITVKTRGRAQVNGKLGDGTKVNVSGQVIAGEDGVCCLPIIATPYPGRTGGFSCNLWFKHGWLFNVTGVSKWTRTRKGAFSVNWTPIYAALPGTGDIAGEMEMLFSDPPMEIQGLPLAKDPEADTITVRGNKWKGTELSEFIARLTPRTGSFAGSMCFYLNKSNNRIKRIKATVYGVVVGGTGYGAVSVNGVGSWAFRLSSCAACED